MYNCDKCNDNKQLIEPNIICDHCKQPVKTMIDSHPTFFCRYECPHKLVDVVCVSCYNKGIRLKGV